MKAKKEITLLLGIMILLGIIINLVPTVLATFSSESTSPDDWRMFERYLNHSGYTNSFAPPNISTAPVQTYTNIGLYAYYTGSVSNGTLFFGDNGGIFHALNASNISKVINRRTFDDLSISPSMAGDSLYMGGDVLTFYQLNLSDTNQTFATYSVPGSNGNAYYGSAVSNGYLYVTTGNDGKFYQFNATNISQFIASYTFGSRTYTEPAIANGYAYLSVSTGSLYQLNATNVSRSIASYNIGTGSSAYSAPSVTENYVYVGSNDNKVYQLNASNVSILVATYTTGNVVWGAPAIAHGYVYIGSNDNVFYQLNASNISIQVSNYTSTSGFLNEIAVNDLYAFTTDSSSLYQFDAFNVRNLIGKVSAGSNLGSGPVIAEGIVYMAGGTSVKMSQYGSAAPYITQTQPINNFEFAYSLQNITFNCTVDDSKGLENVSFYITNNTNKSFVLNATTNFTGLQTFKANWTLELAEGNYTWACLVYDNDGNYVWSSNRSMIHDLKPPVLTITTPTNNTKTSDTNLDINYTVTDQNLASCWYSNDTYSVNTTLASCANIVTLTWGEGQHNLTIWSNDTKDNINKTLLFFTIDITYPAFVNITNRTQEYGISLNTTINVTDSTGISCFTVNDTNFTINCLGHLRNNTLIAIGLYNLNITSNDTSNNLNYTTFWVNVSDTFKPAFTSISNQSVYDLNGIAVDFNASDIHGVSCFGINDTAFTINCTGFLQNNTALNASIYNLNISVNDTSSNHNYSTILINVTLKPIVGMQLLYPTSDINVTRYGLFNVSVNVSCTRANCNGINIT
ncbi:PQQ-binding-like beta-propeller repeat protein, partial [Candidatus Woesearchaeota archaeon]|nr:PQQ-binding-like beta-propeller repeat protein [Candidatus Woesearchaeota archaeon]